MLTDAEKTELRHLLKLLSTDEIVSLKDTITNKLIETTSNEEAIEAILAHSESAYELLYRKKLNRVHIFKYLANKKVNVSVNASKQDLAGMVLVILKGIDCMNDGDHSKEALQTRKKLPELLNKEKQGKNEASKVKRKVPDSSSERNHCSNEATKTQDAVTELPTSQQQLLAVQFSKWFYNLLNSYNPCQAKSPLGLWGPHHFWSDCQLVLNIYLIDEDRKESFEGADVVSERLLTMAKEELLLFNPNLSEFGTKGKMNEHGVTMVLVCGTLHQKSECLGTFEQCFALISDPTSQNNWKIKSTNLRIKRKDVKSIPRLQDASLLALTAE